MAGLDSWQRRKRNPQRRSARGAAVQGCLSVTPVRDRGHVYLRQLPRASPSSCRSSPISDPRQGTDSESLNQRRAQPFWRILAAAGEGRLPEVHMQTTRDTCIALAAGLVLAACAGTPPEYPIRAAHGWSRCTAGGCSGACSLFEWREHEASQGLPTSDEGWPGVYLPARASPESRAAVVETCLTAAEFEERAKNGQDFRKGLQETPSPGPVRNGWQGLYPGF